LQGVDDPKSAGIAQHNITAVVNQEQTFIFDAQSSIHKAVHPPQRDFHQVVQIPIEQLERVTPKEVVEFLDHQNIGSTLRRRGVNLPAAGSERTIASLVRRLLQIFHLDLMQADSVEQ
jgi:hypothetical protein